MTVNEIKKTIEQVVRTEYVAEDGTVFYNEDECKKYEDSALFAVSNKLKKVCEDTRQWELLGFGSDEEYIEIFDIQTEEDLDNLKRYIYLTLLKNGNSEKLAKKYLTAPEEKPSPTGLYNITSGHEVLIFWSYEWDHAWTYGNGSLEGYFGYVESQYSKIIMPTETDNEEVK